MRTLYKVADAIDFIIDCTGRVLVWTMPLVVVIAAAVVILRYGFNTGFPWLSEAFVWLNGAIFTLGAAYLMRTDSHVRVDVLYSRLPPRGKALVNIVGVLILLWPSMYVIAVGGWPSVARSLASREHSPTMDGLPFLYALKLCVPLFCALVSLQGLSLFIRSLGTLTGSDRPLRDAKGARP